MTSARRTRMRAPFAITPAGHRREILAPLRDGLAMAMLAAATLAAVGARSASAERISSVGTPVTAAVVYPDRALVTRSASVACGPSAVATFTGIPPVVDRASFRGETSLGVVQGVRWQERAREEAFSVEVAAVELDIERLEREAGIVADALQRERAAAELAGQYAQAATQYVAREMLDPKPPIAVWRGALEQTLDERLRASNQIALEEDKARDIGRKLDERRRRLGELTAGRGRREIVAEVVVDCPTGKTAKVDVAYMVGGAGWQPAYEARLAENGQVVVSTYATVTQATGESWKSARLVLSTAVPRQDATPPEVRPLRLWADEREPPKKVLVSRQEAREHAKSGGGGAASETRLAMDDQGLSVQLVVPDASDVPGDGTPTRLLVARTPMRGDLSLRSSAAILPYAFRVAELTNGAPFPLLPGPVDAFRNNAFIGRTRIDHVGRGAHFALTFGIEDGIKIERTTLKEATEEKGLLGGTIQYRYAYALVVTNVSRGSHEVELHESVPVSELSDVKVSIDGKTTGGYQHRKEDGLVLWRLKLKAAERRRIDLEFRVDAPSSYAQ